MTSYPDVPLRAAVSNRCNFACCYCPKGDWAAGGMENYTPDRYAGMILTAEQYAAALARIRHIFRIRTISFTGGEPSLNGRLPELLRIARTLFERIEVTTNGSRLTHQLIDTMASVAVDHVKLSLDTVDPGQFVAITGVRRGDELQRVRDAVGRLRRRGLRVALNAVVMKRTLPGLIALIEFAVDTGCSVHLLDYVCHASKRQDWEEQFVPMEALARPLADRYGPPREWPRYGWKYLWFDVADTYIRLKDSAAATMRAPACEGCGEYCQEGPYGLKLSVEGWVTACQSLDLSKGALLAPDLGEDAAAERLAPLRHMFANTWSDTGSFQKFLRAQNLHPRVTQNDVRVLFEAGATRCGRRDQRPMSPRPTPPGHRPLFLPSAPAAGRP